MRGKEIEMADIPFGTYTVQLGKSSNNWADGALVYNSATDVKYKGNDVSGSFNADENDVGWSVYMSHGNCNPASNQLTVFSGGVYNSGNLGSGSVTGPCLSTGIGADPSDTWSAASSMEGHERHQEHSA